MPGYSDLLPGYAAYASGAAVVTPSDSVALTTPSRLGIYVGGAGNVSALLTDGSTVTFTAPPVGSILPIRATRINATGTTATLLIALY